MTSADQLRRLQQPRNNGKARTSIMDELVCHSCRRPVEYETALRIPAYDFVKNGSRYLVCSEACAKGLPVTPVNL